MRKIKMIMVTKKNKLLFMAIFFLLLPSFCVSFSLNYEIAAQEKPQLELVKGGNFKPLMVFKGSIISTNNSHIIYLDDFFIGKTEVTVSDFAEFCNKANYRTKVEIEGGYYEWNQEEFRWEPKRGASWKNPGYNQKNNYPVVLVDWYDCIEYCNWRSKIDGFEPVYTIDKNNKDSNNSASDNRKWIVTFDQTKNGYRLPTASEWEYAMRGGTKAKNLKYGSSDNVDEISWTTMNSKHVMQTATKKPNELGLYDMLGNASEWCWDWFGENTTTNNPIGPTAGRQRWVMNGMEDDQLIFIPLSPAQPSDQVGFRIVRNAK